MQSWPSRVEQFDRRLLGSKLVQAGFRTVTTTTDTITPADNGRTILYNSASAVAVSIAAASSDGLRNFAVNIINIGAGTVTITPTTSTVDTVASLAIRTNKDCTLLSDNANFYTLKGLSNAGMDYLYTSGAIGAVASFEFTTALHPLLFNGTYSAIQFRCLNLKPASDGVSGYLTLSVAAAYIAGTSYENANTGRTSGGTGTGSSATTGSAQFNLTGDNTVGNNTNESYSSVIEMFLPHNATVYKQLQYQTNTTGTSTTLTGQAQWATFKNTGAVDKAKFAWSGGGNYSAGEIRAYGIL